MNRLGFLLSVMLFAGCTPGGLPAAGGGSSAATVTIDVNLTNHGSLAPTPGGQGLGYAPIVATVAVGTTIRFTNSDGFLHTATSLGSATTFPSGNPFSPSQLTQSGTTLSGGWSSGDLPAGSSSQSLLADKPGTYLYGCVHHYFASMRAAIVVH
ncbi:MAG: hypothetical protein JO043_04940 [Candidatus Eremiobacteraeota bacterium]|nr:hypothetical protein [Candidatus Eremiobacteraeota bacterium]